MKFKSLLLLTLAFAAMQGSAKVKLPHILSDNMVLQQQTDVKLWGEAAPNKKVVVKTSWNKKKFYCMVDNEGKWGLTVPTPVASFTPQTIEISDGEAVKLNNVLIGEIWLAGGQSNMQMPVGGVRNCPTEGANETILHSGQYRNKIRFVKIPTGQSYKPENDTECHWLEAAPENTANFCAAAYFFAENLVKVLNVPVGVIDCNWGGTVIESWMDRETLESYGNVPLEKKVLDKMLVKTRPMLMYNAMLHPVINYTLKGFLWYQGESNVNAYQTYAQRMVDMVACWRKDWGLSELPFYYVEIAPYRYSGNRNTEAAYLREAQFKAQQLIPNSGMVSTNDLVYPYEDVNIHPTQKKEVGLRLSYFALAETYGVKGVQSRGPEFNRVEFKDGKAKVYFNHVEQGYNHFDRIEGFEVCGEDKVFYPAVATVDGYGETKVTVSSEKVKHPIAVRYCFRNFQMGNLKGAFGLPAVPFRSDNFNR